MLTAVLIAAAVAAGVTGAWSPCGFSMVDTLAPSGYAGRLAVTAAACVTFALGALAGGVATFGGLALAGSALGAGGTAATAVAAAVALFAAAGEARAARIVPQVRRQVPESWRRVLPLPLAAGLYGVLLGLGFTTFILTFAVWALAGVSVALGDPSLGVLTGLGFGLGRLLPVVVLAPAAGREWGSAAHAAMAERPAILRGLRAVDAAALAACALALWAAPAQAATRPQVVARGATDPSADGSGLAWHGADGSGVFARGAVRLTVPRAHPAVGGGRAAWAAGGAVHVRGGVTLDLPAPGADAVAVDAGWVAWRAREGGRDVLRSARLPSGAAGPVVRAPRRRELGRPALDGSRLLFHRTTAGGAEIRMVDLAGGRRVTLRARRRALLLNPSASGGRLLYVRATYRRQRLVIGRLARRSTRRDRTLWSTFPTGRRDAGHGEGHAHAPGHVEHMWPRPPRGRHDTMWTTALTPGAAYVTRLRERTGHPVRATLFRIPR